MAKPSWIRAADGDWYRASEVVAVKTMPHNPEGGFMVTVETHRHDNIDVTGRITDADAAASCRDALAHLLAQADEGTVITYGEGRFATESV
ncbi:hypothetical protein [Actinomycetospora cinnamomea]|uniref:Uncharacterized protein n=1 Tax=Actinomycetospora cinnamomea TaxID=663609 RepID=A0A2U1EVI7_9PSEU|nr:hypothetical protein [Actinomycetospora cinnamomea]PVZ03921.1 hypothetical protein C8D89_11930 [Actinomycetospora cinnamomea]